MVFVCQGWQDAGRNDMYCISNSTFQVECAKAAAVLAMANLAKEHQSQIEKVMPYVDPMTLRASVVIPKGEQLVLVCCSTKLVTKKSSASVQVTVVDHTNMMHIFYAQPQNKDSDEDIYIAPYFYVQHTQEDDDNMKADTMTVKIDSFTVEVPVLVSCKRIKEGEFFKVGDAKSESLKTTDKAESMKATAKKAKTS